MARPARSRRHTVATVICHGVAPFEMSVPCEVFGIDRSELGVPWYRHLVCAAEDRPIRSSQGFTIDTPNGLEEVLKADTVVVPAWGAAQLDQDPPPALIDALQAAHRRGARILSVCSGAFVLAAAGLLDGRRATTHWMYADELQARYPDVQVDPDVLYVAESNVMTSAGTAAGIDLCLHIVALDHGADAAAAVARRMLMPLFRPGGQAQYVDAQITRAESDAMSDLLTWGIEHLAAGVSVDDLARRAAVSSRTLTRRFRTTVGVAPGEWLQRERLRLAQRLLETSNAPIDQVARDAGYDTSAALRAQFSARLHTSPRAYRLTFRRN